MKHGENVIVLAVISVALTLLLLIPVYYLWDFVLFLQGEGMFSMLSMDNVMPLVILVLIISFWILGLSKMYKSLSSNMRLLKEPKQKAQKLKKEKDSIDLFREVAEREYFKGRISEETFKKITQLCEEKDVEIKVKLKEMGAEDLIKEIKESE